MFIRNRRGNKKRPTRGAERLNSRLQWRKKDHCDVTQVVMDGLAFEIFRILGALVGIK